MYMHCQDDFIKLNPNKTLDVHTRNLNHLYLLEKFDLNEESYICVVGFNLFFFSI